MKNKFIIIILLALVLISLSFYLLEKEKLNTLKVEVAQKTLADQEAALFSNDNSDLKARVKSLEYQVKSLESRIGPRCVLIGPDENLSKL